METVVVLALYLVFLAAFVIACGCVAGSIARKRGRSYGAFFAFGFFFGVIGVMAAAFATRRTGEGEPSAPVAATVVHHHHHYYDASGREIDARLDVEGRTGSTAPAVARPYAAPAGDGLTEGQRIARAVFDASPPAPVARPVAAANGSSSEDSESEGRRIARRAFAEKPVKIGDKRPVRAR